MSKVKKSIKYIFVGNLFSKGISFIGSITLANILFPDDYGYLLKASIITGFIQMFGNMGFENYYLQEKIDSERQRIKILNITSKLRFIVNFILFLVQFLSSYFIEYYMSNPILGIMLRVFSFVILVNGVTQINMYILRKKLDFIPETKANIVRDVVSTIVKILFAWLGFGALSFAYGALIGNLGRTLVFLKNEFYLPNLKDKDKETWNKILFFGKHSFYVGVLGYLNDQIDKIYLSKFYTNKEVGLYSFSNQYASMPFNYLATPFSSFILSYSSQKKGDKENLFNNLLKIVKILTLLFFPIFLIGFFYTSEIFHVVFNSKWDGAIPVFRVLLVYYFLTITFFFPFVGLITAHGKPNILTKITLWRLINLVSFLPIFYYFFKSIVFFVICFSFISIFFYIVKANISLNFLNKTVISIFYNLKKEVITISLLFLFLILNSIFINKFILPQIFSSIFLFLILEKKFIKNLKKDFFK